MLGKEMMYSCAFWGTEEGGPRGDLTVGPTEGDLEAAQLRKIHRLLRFCRLRPGDRLLEFGTGWGAIAIEVSLCNIRRTMQLIDFIGGKNGLYGRYSNTLGSTESLGR